MTGSFDALAITGPIVVIFATKLIDKRFDFFLEFLKRRSATKKASSR